MFASYLNALRLVPSKAPKTSIDIAKNTVAFQTKLLMHLKVQSAKRAKQESHPNRQEDGQQTATQLVAALEALSRQLKAFLQVAVYHR